MKQLARYFSLLIALAGPVSAEDILQLGLKNAVSIFTPVPEEAARGAQTTAAGLLGRYVKRQGETYLCQHSAIVSGNWMELNGLKLSRVTYQAVSDADKANGIQERFSVSVDCGLYRTRKPGDSSWSLWVNGRPLFIPGAIEVEHRTNGQWTASRSSLKYFNPIGDARPAVNPASDGLPAGMSHAMAPAASPLPPVAAPAQNITQFSANSAPVPPAVVHPAPSPSTPVARARLPRLPQTGNSSAVPEQLTHPFKQVMPWLIGVIVVISIIPQVLKKSKHSTPRRTNYRRGSPQGPPPLPKPAPTARRDQSPVTPSPAGDPLNLIQRSENLLPPAELAFFAVLEPLIPSSYRISAKVRLADLFNAANGPGQQTAFNKIVGKHIDFVVTDSATSRILCGIELDDSSHQRPDRIQRDQFVNEVFERNQLPLLRIPFSWTYYAAGLRAELTKAGLSLSVEA